MPRYIDADDFAARLSKKLTADTEKEAEFMAMLACAVMMILTRTPTAEVEPVRHGRWKFNSDGSATCSACGITQRGVWDYDHANNYCGICGAKMDLEEEENEDR